MIAIQSMRIFNSARICGKNPSSTVLLYFQSQKAFLSNVEEKKRSTSKPEKKELLKKIQSSSVLSKLSDNLNLDVKPYLKKYKSLHEQYYFVADEDVAKEIVEKTINYFNNENSLTVEHNPGLGLITHFLIKSELKNFIVLDSSYLSMMPFKKLYKKHSKMIELHDVNFLKSYSDFRNTILSLLELGAKSNKIIKMIGVLPLQIHFSRYIYLFLDDYNRNVINFMELYVVTSETVVTNFKKFEGSRGKFSTFCIENNFFNLELLAEFPQSAFLPFLGEKMYLVRMTAKENCFDKIGEENVNLYISFLRVLERRRKSFVIKTLETWLPDCGPLLISKGISCTTRILDLTAEETLHLFKICKTWKTFDNFIYLQSYFQRFKYL